MNKVVLIGRLTSDAEIKQFGENNKSVLKFTIAVDRNYLNANNEREADFIPVAYWTDHAEKLLGFLLKGRLIGVNGSIKVKSYDLGDGKRKYFTEIDCTEIKFLDRLKDKTAEM